MIALITFIIMHRETKPLMRLRLPALPCLFCNMGLEQQWMDADVIAWSCGHWSRGGGQPLPRFLALAVDASRCAILATIVG